MAAGPEEGEVQLPGTAGREQQTFSLKRVFVAVLFSEDIVFTQPLP